MSFSSLVAAMDDRISNTFSPKTAVFHYASGLPDSAPVSVVPKNPVMEEDYVPGSPVASQSVGVLILWFRPVDVNGTAITSPLKGDTFTYGSGDYDITRDGVDREGGVTVYGRLRTQRYDR